MRRSTAALLAAAAALVLGDAGASTSVAIPFDALVQASSAAAFVTPVTETSVWEGGRIVTYTDVHVDELVAGSGLAAEVWVRTLGGEVGQIGQIVEGEPVFTVGRPSLVFVKPARVLPSQAEASGEGTIPGVYAVTARAQGQFPVVLDDKGELRVGESSAIGATVTPKGAVPELLAADALRGLKVKEVAGTVGRSWSRLHVQ